MREGTQTLKHPSNTSNTHSYAQTLKAGHTLQLVSGFEFYLFSDSSQISASSCSVSRAQEAISLSRISKSKFKNFSSTHEGITQLIQSHKPISPKLSVFLSLQKTERHRQMFPFAFMSLMRAQLLSDSLSCRTKQNQLSTLQKNRCILSSNR